MQPTLLDGDRLLVRYGAVPRRGRLVVVRLSDGVVAVKRAVHQGPDGWWVERDSPTEGVDSWSVGAIPDENVIGRVVCRVWPLRGPLSRRPHSL